mmetsp:Transcript_8915/g.22494  ORF Transcript_8915/g.22494 Transcript_8915/m.22494 type:complete len:222 (+) Transcript_8915:1265-1930(+)
MRTKRVLCSMQYGRQLERGVLQHMGSACDAAQVLVLVFLRTLPLSHAHLFIGLGCDGRWARQVLHDLVGLIGVLDDDGPHFLSSSHQLVLLLPSLIPPCLLCPLNWLLCTAADCTLAGLLRGCLVAFGHGLHYFQGRALHTTSANGAQHQHLFQECFHGGCEHVQHEFALLDEQRLSVDGSGIQAEVLFRHSMQHLFKHLRWHVPAGEVPERLQVYGHHAC